MDGKEASEEVVHSLRLAGWPHLQSQDSPGGEAKDSAFLSSRDTDLLEPTEWTQGCRASSSVWREDPVFLAWEIPWTEEPGGPQSIGSQRV